MRSLVVSFVIALTPLFAQAQLFELCGGEQQLLIHTVLVDPALCDTLSDSEFLFETIEDSAASRHEVQRFRCDRQVAFTDASVWLESQPQNFAGRIEGSVTAIGEVGSLVPVADGGTNVFVINYLTARFCTDLPRRFHLTGAVRVSGSVLDPAEVVETAYAGLYIVQEPAAIDLRYEVGFAQPGELRIDTMLTIPAGEFEISAGVDNRLEQDSMVQNGQERLEASVEFEMVAEPCSADLTWDNRVDIADLAALLSNFYGGHGRANGDFNADHRINLDDLAILLSVFGEECTF